MSESTHLPAEMQSVGEVPPEAFTLAAAVRSLIDGTVQTQVDPAERAAVAAELRLLTARLEAQRRTDPVWFVRHENGALEHLTQAATGRLNPLAFDGAWLTTEGEETSVPAPDPETGETLARYTFTGTHGVAPDVVGSGAIALLLDHVISFATAAVERGGMTVALEIRCHRPTPYDTPLLVRARYTHTEGRKHFASGEIIAGDTVTASALGVFISHPTQRPPAFKAQ